MFRLRSLGALIALFCAGIAAALVQSTSAQVPLPTLTSTTVTLTTPTLPPPLPPPTTATVTAPLPEPPPPPSAPITSAITSVTQPSATTAFLPAPSDRPSSSSPPRPTTGGGSGTSSGGGGSSSGAGGSSSSGGVSGGFASTSPGASSSDRAPERRLEPRTDRSGRRVVVRLEFVLPEARRLFLIVRGPVPSCRVVGVVPVRGRAGENVIRFGGRVHGRLLERGVYRLTLSPQPRVVPQAPTELVRVVSPWRTVPLPENARQPSCASAAALAADPDVRLLAAEHELGEAARAQTAPARPVAPLRPPLAVPGSGDAEPRFPDLIGDAGNLARGDGEEGVGSAAMLAVIVVIGLLLLTMLALVTRFFRGTWNP